MAFAARNPNDSFVGYGTRVQVALRRDIPQSYLPGVVVTANEHSSRVCGGRPRRVKHAGKKNRVASINDGGHGPSARNNKFIKNEKVLSDLPFSAIVWLAPQATWTIFSVVSARPSDR